MQFHEIGEHDIAGGLHQADMARGGDRVGALVISDRVGKQDLVALADLDIALGDGHAQILVVLHFVGGEEQRLRCRRLSVIAGGANLAGRGKGTVGSQ